MPSTLISIFAEKVAFDGEKPRKGKRSRVDLWSCTRHGATDLHSDFNSLCAATVTSPNQSVSRTHRGRSPRDRYTARERRCSSPPSFLSRIAKRKTRDAVNNYGFIGPNTPRHPRDISGPTYLAPRRRRHFAFQHRSRTPFLRLTHSTCVEAFSDRTLLSTAPVFGVCSLARQSWFKNARRCVMPFQIPAASHRSVGWTGVRDFSISEREPVLCVGLPAFRSIFLLGSLIYLSRGWLDLVWSGI